ncbi:hypothetical protein ASG17_07660 [Brevundimonas sp. Leaf363]|nr:hypothetical protein ASG17_07660 [Brevundimonas sp. Leaf363]
MREFYRRIADLITAISAVSGSGAFVALFLVDRTTLIAKILMAVVGVTSTLNLVYGFAKKADLHDKLTKDFTKLAADMALWPADDEHLHQARSRRITIEADEPHVRQLINLRAQNDEWRARGVPEDRMCPLTKRQKSWWLAYFMDWGLAELEDRIHERNRP